MVSGSLYLFLIELYVSVQVQIAIQTYELVDKHIRKLDGDLAKFESEMKENILINDKFLGVSLEESRNIFYHSIICLTKTRAIFIPQC